MAAAPIPVPRPPPSTQAARLRRPSKARQEARPPQAARQIFTITRPDRPEAAAVDAGLAFARHAARRLRRRPADRELDLRSLILGVAARRLVALVDHVAPGRAAAPTQRMRASRASRARCSRTSARGWYVEDEPVAVDPRTRDLVFRAVGRPGVVLVTEGPLAAGAAAGGAASASASRRVLGPNVPIMVCTSATARARCPLRRLDSTLHDQHAARPSRRPRSAPVAARLRALGGVRPADPEGRRPDPGAPGPQGRARPLIARRA